MNVLTCSGYKFPFICMRCGGKRALVSGLHDVYHHHHHHRRRRRRLILVPSSSSRVGLLLAIAGLFSGISITYCRGFRACVIYRSYTLCGVEKTGDGYIYCNMCAAIPDGNNNNNNMNTSPADGQICMIGKNRKEGASMQGPPAGRSMGPPGNGSYLLPPRVYIIIIIIIIYNTSSSLAVALFSHYIILYRYTCHVCVCVRSLPLLYTTLIFVDIRVCGQNPVRPFVYIYTCIVLNDVSQHACIQYSQPPRRRLGDIVY